MVFNPVKHAFDDSGKPTQATSNFLETTLRVQRPVVLRWVKRLRRQHPGDTPAQIAKRIEKQYIRAVTAGGGATGGLAMVPGIGTVASLGVSAASVGAYLELTALYAQSIAELHGVPTEDPERTRAMVMALMLGEDGEALMGQILAKSSKTGLSGNKWGLMLASGSGKGTSASRTLRNMFIKRFITRQSGAFIGRALPFGVGAVVGGGANYALARSVVKATHEAFGELGATFPPALEGEDRAPKFIDDAGTGKKGRGRRRAEETGSVGELTGTEPSDKD